MLLLDNLHKTTNLNAKNHVSKIPIVPRAVGVRQEHRERLCGDRASLSCQLWQNKRKKSV